MPDTAQISTTHMDCAAALMALGHRCDHINADNPYKVEFFFDDKPEVLKAMDDHHNQRLQVISVDYWEALRKVRERLSYIKNRRHRD